jgi:dTDP-4-amino-4,6-dideoxy-D-galactose acyltransferase
MIRPLDWDSNFFGIKTGKLDLVNISDDDLFAQLKSANFVEFQLVYIFATHGVNSINEAISKTGAKLYDEKVTYVIDTYDFTPVSSEFIATCKGAEMGKDLEELAIESGIYSRFRIDPKIPRNKFEELYRLWMKNSLDGSFATEVFTYEDHGKRLGMVSVDIRKAEGWIGIIAVNENYRGRSIGKYLIHKAIQYCKDNNVKILNVQTQMLNKVSCAFYEKIGFRVRSVVDVYHLWVD